MPSATFRGLRRDVALAVHGRKRTLYEIGKATGRRASDVQRATRQLHAEGVLEASDPEPTRGTLFWLSRDFADELEQAVADDRPVGQLLANQRVLQVRADADADLYTVMGRPDVGGLISWAAECGGDGELLVAMVEGTTKAQADRLAHALRRAGASCAHRRVGDLLTPRDLRGAAASLQAIDEGEEVLG